MSFGYIELSTTQLGGNWNNGTNARTFYWNLNNTSSNVNRNISTHLANFVKTVRSRYTLPLGKTQKKHVCVGRRAQRSKTRIKTKERS